MKFSMKRGIAVLLVLMTIFTGSSVAMAEEQKTSWDDIKDEIKETFTIGNIGRTFQYVTGYQDTSYIVSPYRDGKGESVRISIEPYEKKSVYKMFAYKTEYQWYQCSSELYTESRKIEGATDRIYDTGEYEETGLYFYYCKVDVYKKGIVGKKYIEGFCSEVFKVGYTGLPVIYINTPDGKVITSKTEWTENAVIRINRGIEDAYSLKETAIRIKGRGNSSWNCYSKSGYTVKLEKGQDIFGLGKSKTWALIANATDKTLMRNRFASELDQTVFDDGSEWNVSHIPVELVLNGEYKGSYTLATTVRLGDKRVNVPDISEEPKKDINGDGTLNYYDCGFLVEVNSRMDEKYNYVSTHGNKFSLVDPDLDDENEGNDAIYQHITGVIQKAEDVLCSDTFCDEEIGYRKYIDVDSFIDYYLLEEFANNQDSTFKLSNFIYYEPRDGKLHMTGAWDFDLSFGNADIEDCASTKKLTCRRGWYLILFKDPAFEKQVAERWKEIRNKLENAVRNTFPEMVEKSRVSAKMNFSKWKMLGLPIWPMVDGYWERLTYQSEVDFMYDWMLERMAYLDTVFQ